MSRIMSIVALIALAPWASAIEVTSLTNNSTENRIYIEDFTISPGETKTIQVMMDNDEPITQLQFFLTPSDGLSFKDIGYSEAGTDRWYYYDEEEDDEYYSHTFYSTMIDGQYRYFLISFAQKEIQGNSGPILNLKVIASEDFTGGFITMDCFKMVTSDDEDITGGIEYGGDEIIINVDVTTETNVHTLVCDTITNRHYINLSGQVSDYPFDGLNLVVTRYSDGSQQTSKVFK